MDNQHRKISGYRELTQSEIDLMNEVKALGPQIEAVLNKVRSHIHDTQRDNTILVSRALRDGDGPNAERANLELERITSAEPQRWTAIAATDFQTGLMALTRAVAQPEFF